MYAVRVDGVWDGHEWIDRAISSVTNAGVDETLMSVANTDDAHEPAAFLLPGKSRQIV